MGLFNKQKQFSDNNDLSIEKRLDTNQLKRLDKLYIIIACFLSLSWLIWNFSGIKDIKLSHINFSFIGDYISDFNSLRNQKSLIPNYLDSIAVKGNYIYYNDYETASLYSIDRNTSEAKRIYTGDLQGLRYADGFLYFSVPGKAGIIRTRPDGSQVSKIADDADSLNYFIDDNRIYYSSHGILFSTSLDGKNKSYITDQIRDSQFFPYGNWIYYIDSSDLSIYKIRKTGKDKTLVHRIENTLNGSIPCGLGIYKGWIYYIRNTELYRCKIDGSKLTLISNGINNYSIEGNVLYYSIINLAENTSQNDASSSYPQLFTSRLDGSRAQRILDDQKAIAYFGEGIIMKLPGDIKASLYDMNNHREIPPPRTEYRTLLDNLWPKVDSGKSTFPVIKSIVFDRRNLAKTNSEIFYINPQTNTLYKTDLNGHDSNLGLGMADNIQGIGNLLFYLDTQNNFLYCMDVDTQNKRRVFDFRILDYVVYDKGVYFLSLSNHIYNLAFKDNKIVKISDETIYNFKMVNDYFYYLFNNTLFRMKTDGTLKEKILDNSSYQFYITGEYIYYKEAPREGDQPVIYKQRIGGKERIPFINSSTWQFLINSKYVLYSDANSGWYYLQSLDGMEKLDVGSRIGGGYLYMDDKYIYYYDNSGKLLRQEISKEAFKRAPLHITLTSNP